MEIQSYSFGKITVGDETYEKDVIIFDDRVFSPWWRKDGHRLEPNDLFEALTEGSTLIIVGTGASGVMQVPRETLVFFESRGIKVEAYRTAEAVERYNAAIRSGGKGVAAALHLTC